MKSREILEKIKELSKEEKRNLSYDKLKEIMEYMTPDEIIKLYIFFVYVKTAPCGAVKILI